MKRSLTRVVLWILTLDVLEASSSCLDHPAPPCSWALRMPALGPACPDYRAEEDEKKIAFDTLGMDSAEISSEQVRKSSEDAGDYIWKPTT